MLKVIKIWKKLIKSLNSSKDFPQKLFTNINGKTSSHMEENGGILS